MRKMWAAGLIALSIMTMPSYAAIPYPKEADHQVWANRNGLTRRAMYEATRESVPIYSVNDVKKFEDVRCITDRTSKAYQVVKDCRVDKFGSCMIGDRHVIAVGTAIGEVGDKIDIQLQDYDGQKHVLKCIIGDQKRTEDTYGGMNYCGVDGHIIEALVVTQALPRKVQLMGDLSYIPEWEGRIINIWRLK